MTSLIIGISLVAIICAPITKIELKLFSQLLGEVNQDA